MTTEIPEALLNRVPAESRNRQCICQPCLQEFQAKPKARSGESSPLQPDDYYFDRNNLMVFTATYLERRGYCCGNGCRHCPYPSR